MFDFKHSVRLTIPQGQIQNEAEQGKEKEGKAEAETLREARKRSVTMDSDPLLRLASHPQDLRCPLSSQETRP